MGEHELKSSHMLAVFAPALGFGSTLETNRKNRRQS